MAGRVWGRTCGMPVPTASHILGSCQPGVPQVCSRPLPFLPPKGELGLVGQPEDCRQSGRLCCCHPPRALVTHPLPTPRPVQVPLFHCFGMVMGSLACTTHGATMVLPSESFDAEVRCAALHPLCPAKPAPTSAVVLGVLPVSDTLTGAPSQLTGSGVVPAPSRFAMHHFDRPWRQRSLGCSDTRHPQ